MIRIIFLFIMIMLLSSLVDLLNASSFNVRTFKKITWIFILFIPIIGPILWIVAGRPLKNLKYIAPDDDSNFLNNIKIDKKKDSDNI